MNFHQSFLFFVFSIPTNYAIGHMYNPLMIIYGELLFAENMIMGAVLLYITALIHKIPLSARSTKLRILMGSLMCGAFSMVIFISDGFPPNAKAPLMILMEVVFALGVCWVTFGNCKIAITFVLVTYFMGGMTMGLLLLTRQQGIYTAAGIYTGDMKAGMLAIFIGISLATAKQIVKTVRMRKIIEQHVYRAKLVIGEVSIETEAFVDTGNHLKDPVGGKPVAIASGELWEIIQSHGLPIEERFTVVPYTAVGSRGLLEAVRLDYMELGTRCIKGCVVAKSDGDFKLGKSSNCRLLISAEIVGL